MTESIERTERGHLHGGAGSVPCFHCAHTIPADTFIPWTGSTRLISASCPACTRRTTLSVESRSGFTGLPHLPSS
jgi:hypothetical protein